MADTPIYQSLLDSSMNKDITSVFDDVDNNYGKLSIGDFKQWINNQTRLNAFNMNNLNSIIQGYGNWVGNTTFRYLNTYLIQPLIESSAGWTYNLADPSAGGEVFNDYFNNTAKGNHASAFGTGSNADNENQFVIGKFNASNPDAVFMVGWGENENSRKNIFTVLQDGRAQTEAAPVDPKDLINKQHLDTELERVKQLNQWIGNLSVTSEQFDLSGNNAKLKPLLTDFVKKNSPSKRNPRNGDLVTVTITDKKPTDPQYPEIWIFLEQDPSAPVSSGDWYFYSSQQELLNASKEVKGLVQIGNNINVNEGLISVPVATSSTLGLVKNGKTLKNSNGTLDVNISDDLSIADDGTITIPRATKYTAGIVQVGENIGVDNGIVSVAVATKSSLGVVSVGDNIDVKDGKITVTATNIADALGYVPADSASSGGGGSEYILPIATATRLGGIKVGEGLDIDGAGVLSASAKTLEWVDIIV